LFDDGVNPLDKVGRLYRPGVRLCGYRDCVVVELEAFEVWSGADTYPVPGAKIEIWAL